MERIFLIGPPGAGKTACGQALAKRLGCAFYDTDRLIESEQGTTIKEIFASRGEPYFRELERRLLDDLPQSCRPESECVVFGTGGGLPVYNENLQRLQVLGKVIALFADVSVLVDRVKSNSDRPLLAQRQNGVADKELQARLQELLAERMPVYAQAGYKIDTSGLDPEQVADEIVRILYGA